MAVEGLKLILTASIINAGEHSQPGQVPSSGPVQGMRTQSFGSSEELEGEVEGRTASPGEQVELRVGRPMCLLRGRGPAGCFPEGQLVPPVGATASGFHSALFLKVQANRGSGSQKREVVENEGKEREEKKGQEPGSEEPACPKGTRCQLQQEACYSWTLLEGEMGTGREYGEEDSQADLCICLSIHSSSNTMDINTERQLLTEVKTKEMSEWPKSYLSCSTDIVGVSHLQ